MRCHHVTVPSRLAATLLITTVASANAQVVHRTILTHANIFNGSAHWLRDRTIVIDDSMITAIDSARAPIARPGDRAIDVRGRFVIPGLIDTHVHLATEPDGEDTRERALVRLAAAIRGGITNVRDMAGDARRLADYARSAAVTNLASPDIRSAALFAGPSPPLDSVLRRMAASLIVFDPTLFVMDSARELQVASAVTRRAHQLGVLISTGTDSIAAADSMSLPNVHSEIALLVHHAGFTPAEALVAATANGARTLGIFDHVGSIAVGKRADLVVLAADPLADIGNTRAILLVMKRGVIFRDEMQRQ